MHNRARYIDHRIRELVTGASPEVRLCEIAGGDQPSDIFIKGLLRLAFDKHMCRFSWENCYKNMRARMRINST